MPGRGDPRRDGPVPGVQRGHHRHHTQHAAPAEREALGRQQLRREDKRAALRRVRAGRGPAGRRPGDSHQLVQHFLHTAHHRQLLHRRNVLSAGGENLQEPQVRWRFGFCVVIDWVFVLMKHKNINLNGTRSKSTQ